ncbi:hypothetical protein G5I_11661 [Acromyrmex echinatior]|uniref:Uncharacterized protein n=1 Tax=Acromyrmex echinatior TaxID=103372 RepID=F4X0A4_ACREC|nr:hypothetical protein G5I_11661 [Acromyrmex echinatior]
MAQIKLHEMNSMRKLKNYCYSWNNKLASESTCFNEDENICEPRLASFDKTPRGCTFDLAPLDEIAMQNDRLRGSAAVGPITTGRSLRKFRGSHGSVGQIPSGYGYVSRREALHGK